MTFLDPHGLVHGSGLGDEKILFHRRIKDIEGTAFESTRCSTEQLCFVMERISPIKMGKDQKDLEDMHVLFMKNDKDGYLDKLFQML